MIAHKSKRSDGESRKHEAHAILQARRDLYVRRGRRELFKTALLIGSATADDVRACVQLPADIDPVLFQRGAYGACTGWHPRTGGLHDRQSCRRTCAPRVCVGSC